MNQYLYKSSKIEEKKYNLFIPKNVENKIRKLCSHIYNKEWSGVLFYTIIGSFEEDNIEIHCKDILPLDIDNAVYTSYIYDKRVINYVAMSDLMNIDNLMTNGLIHSHNVMGTFMSGTDIHTLHKEGNDTIHFLSLIVNNDGKYTAAITRKKEIIKEIKTKSRFFNLFNNKYNNEYNDETNTETNTEIEYQYLNIIIEQEDEEFNSLVDELINNNKNNVIKYQNNNFSQDSIKFNNIQNDTQLELFNNSYNDELFNYHNKDFQKKPEFMKNTKNHEIIDDLSNNTSKFSDLKDDGNFTLDIDYDSFTVSDVNLKKVLTILLNLNPVFDNQSVFSLNLFNNFINNCVRSFKDFKNFESFADSFIENTLYNINDDSLVKEGFEEEDISAIYAYKIISFIEDYYKNKITNKYIDTYLSILNNYII